MKNVAKKILGLLFSRPWSIPVTFAALAMLFATIVFLTFTIFFYFLP